MNSKKMLILLLFLALTWSGWLAQFMTSTSGKDWFGSVIGRDFTQFYAAGHIIRHGDDPGLYSWDVYQKLIEDFTGVETEKAYNFPNPPFFAYLFVPFSYLPYLPAYILWCLTGLVLLWAGISLLGPKEKLSIFLLALAWVPVFACIAYAQNSILTFFILVLTYVLWRKKCVIFSGLVLSLLFYKPYLACGVLIWWVLDWRNSWKAICAATVGFLFFLGAPFILMPKASAAYIEFLGNHSVFTTNLLGYLQPMEHTLGVLWLFLFPAERSLVVILTWVSRCLAAVSFIYLSLRCSRKVWVCFSFAVILVLLVSPHVMLYEWTLLLIPAILHWENNAERRPFLVKYYLLMQIAAVVSISSTEWQQKLFSRSLNLGMVALIFISVGLYRQTLKDLAQS